MTFPFLISREYRARSRRLTFWVVRGGTAAWGMLLAIGMVVVLFSMWLTPAEIGRQVFSGLALFCFVFAGLAGPLFTADAVSQEKREGTLGLLFLTDLTGLDVVLAKLAAAMAPAMYCLAAVLPVLSLAFILGGVTAGELGRAILATLALLGLSLSAGLMISVLSWSGRKALVGSLLVLGFLALLPVWALPLAESGSLLGQGLMLPSPALLWRLIWEAYYLAQPGMFWLALVVHAGLTLALLAWAARRAPYAWMEGTPGEAHRLPGAYRRWRLRQHARRRRHMMEENPVLWMACRRPLSAMLVYAGLFAAGTLATAIYVANLPAGPGKLALVVASFFLHAVLKLWVALEASRRFAEDARSGALELLLVTPMAERTIAMGWIHGLKRLFLAPVSALLVADLFLIGADSDWVVPMLTSMGLLLADVYTLCWVGMWMGLRTGTATTAALRTVGAVLVGPYLVFAGVFVLLGLFMGGRISISPGLAAGILFSVSYLVDMALCVWAIDRIDDDYRAAAARTFER